jgi:hypothetical protein
MDWSDADYNDGYADGTAACRRMPVGWGELNH